MIPRINRCWVAAALALFTPWMAPIAAQGPDCPSGDCCAFTQKWYCPINQSWLCTSNFCHPGCPIGRKVGIPLAGICVECDMSSPGLITVDAQCGECVEAQVTLPVPVFQCDIDSLCYYVIDCAGSEALGVRCKVVQVGTVDKVQGQAFGMVDCPF